MASQQVPPVRGTPIDRYMAAYKKRGEVLKNRESEEAVAAVAEREGARSINVERPAAKPVQVDVSADAERMKAELSAKEEELNRVKNDFQIKMRNTIALQRIKYEKE